MNIKEYVGENKNFKETYIKLINEIGFTRLYNLLPEKRKEVLIKKYKKDKNLNNIQIKSWDNKQPYIKPLLKNLGINCICVSDIVCLLKETAILYIKYCTWTESCIKVTHGLSNQEEDEIAGKFFNEYLGEPVSSLTILQLSKVYNNDFR
jgi:hypothetical protein